MTESRTYAEVVEQRKADARAALTAAQAPNCRMSRQRAF